MKQTAITVSWLNEVLRDLLGEAQVTKFSLSDIGAGVGFGGVLLRVAIYYSVPGAGPASVIIKLPSTDLNTFESLKAQNILLREALFYRDLAPGICLDLPKIYYVSVTADDFVIVMQDLGDVVDQTETDLSMADATIALTSIAKLHAGYWNHPTTREPWLAPVASGDANARIDNLNRLRHAIELLETSPENVDYAITCAKRLIKLIPKAPENISLPKPVTLVHGDFHANNFHLADDDFFEDQFSKEHAPEKRVIIFDWQLISQGTPLMDVANLVVSSCDAQLTTKQTEELLTAYHGALVAAGISGYSLEKVRSSYQDALFFTFMKFLIILGTIDYSAAGGDRLKNDLIFKVNTIAIAVDAKAYIRKLPYLFILMKLINVYQVICKKLS